MIVRYKTIYFKGSIVFLLTRKDDNNYEFEAIGLAGNSDESNLLCHVVQVLRAGATHYGSEQLIQPGTIINWPPKLVAIHKPQKKGTGKQNCLYIADSLITLTC